MYITNRIITSTYKLPVYCSVYKLANSQDHTTAVDRGSEKTRIKKQHNEQFCKLQQVSELRLVARNIFKRSIK